MFTVELTDRQFSVMPPIPALKFIPKRWGGNVRGGHETADIEVKSDAPDDLLSLVDALRYGVMIRNEDGHPAWWGYIHEIKIDLHGTSIALTLDTLANKVRAKYSYENGDGAQEGTTDWQDDAWSQFTYGIKELQIEATDSKPAEAIEKAKRKLRKAKKPADTPTSGSNSTAIARLTCRGWLDVLDWRYFAQPLGRIVHNPSSDASAILGWGFDAPIGFGRNDKTIHQIDCKLVGLRSGDKINITGTDVIDFDSNDGVYTVDEAPSQEKVKLYTSDTITFDLEDDIFDLEVPGTDRGGGLGNFDVGEVILVSGSTNAPNNKHHQLDGVQPDQLTTWTGWNGIVFFSDSEVDVTIKQGCHITTEEAAYRGKEIPSLGINQTVTVTSQQLAQRFTPTETGTWLVGEIAVYVKRWGEPDDDLKMELYSDSSGDIGTLIEDATFTGLDIQKDEMRVGFEFGGVNTVTNGTYYWLILSRTGSYHNENYYEISLSETDLAESLLEFDGTTWASRTPTAAMLHEVWGVRETTLQIQDIAAGSLLSGVDIKQASGIPKPMYRDGNSRKLDEIVKLLDFGVVDERFLFAEVSPERVLRVYASPSFDQSKALLWRNKDLEGQSGSMLPRGAMPYGQYMILADFPQAGSQMAQFSPVLLDTVEYDAESDTYSWTSYGAEDRFA